MLTVTHAAREKLVEGLQELTQDPAMAVRMAMSSEAPRELEFSLDTERHGDQVVFDEGGAKVLLIGAELSQAMLGLVMDYVETPDGAGFTLERLPA